MSETSRTHDVDWRGVGLVGALYGLLLAIAVLFAAYVTSAAGQYLGWPDSMIRIATHTAIGLISLPFVLEAIRPLYRLYTDSDEGDEPNAHTLPEIEIAAESNRRRHYWFQLAKAAGGIALAGLGAGNVYLLVMMRADVIDSLSSAVGDAAATNHRFMVVMMVVMSLIGLGIAVRAWRNRYKSDEEAIVGGLEDLEE